MEFKKISAIYFSPVSSTRFVTEFIVRKLAKQLHHLEMDTFDFTLPENQNTSFHFQKDHLVVFGMPTYAGRIPNKILPLVKQNFFGEGTPVIPVVTFGNRNYDSSLAELANVLEENGFLPFAAGAFSCRHVFSNKIAAGRPDSKDQEEMCLFAKKAARILLENEVEKLQRVVIQGGAAVAPYYTPLGIDGQPAKFLKAKPVTNPNLCNQCGKCAKACPMGAIDFTDCTVVNGTCIKCQACIRQCPVKAKYFDDPAFLSHVAMLESHYTARKENEIFLSPPEAYDSHSVENAKVS